MVTSSWMFGWNILCVSILKRLQDTFTLTMASGGMFWTSDFELD